MFALELPNLSRIATDSGFVSVVDGAPACPLPETISSGAASRRVSASSHANTVMQMTGRVALSAFELIDAEGPGMAAYTCAATKPSPLNPFVRIGSRQTSPLARMLWGHQPGSTYAGLEAFCRKSQAARTARHRMTAGATSDR